MQPQITCYFFQNTSACCPQSIQRENSREKDEQTDLQDSNYLFTSIIGGIFSSTEDMEYKTLDTATAVTML